MGRIRTRATATTEPEVLAEIDIEEPVMIDAGETMDVGFTYKVGDPAADSFLFEWFLTEEFAEQGIHQQTRDVPRAVVTPEAPESGAQQHSGNVRITVWPDLQGRVFYGKISICQTIYEITDVGTTRFRRITSAVFSNWRRGR